MREWVRIAGICILIPSNNFKKSSVKCLIDKVGVKIHNRDNEYSHRGGSQDHTVIKFSHRKDNKPINNER